MLRRLELRDFAIIRELSLELSEGLNVLTGETGAGKSIVVDALSLLAGARADTAFVRAGSEDALVQGEFEGATIQTAGRRVSAAGRHTARLDGEVVTVGELAERVGELVAVFAQHGALELQGPAAQRAQLDRLLPEPDRSALAEHKQAFARRGQVRAQLEEVRAAMRERARRQDVLAYQLQEIEAAKVAVGEDDALAADLATLRHAERIVQSASAAFAALAGDEPSATPLAADALRELRSAARHAPQLAALADDLETAVTGLGAVAAEVEAFLSGFDADPGRLDAVQARLAKLDDLKRKYGDDLPAVVAFAERARRELSELEALDDDEAELEREEAQLSARLEQLGAGLSAARRHAAQELAAQITPLLARLGMPSAVFEVRVAPLDQPHASGSDDVTFLFGANPGEPLGPVSQIASGGELSRLMLALHLVTGATQRTLAFDEVDAGVGGRAAREVGALLAELATGRQVLVVTHLAQVAAFADAHFVVSKSEQAGRTVTSVRRVQGDERDEELARMLSGTVTGAALEHARELVAAAPRPRASR